MNKLLSALIVAAVGAMALPALAASHAGAAPMAKASEPAKKEEKKAAAPMAKASEPAKKEEKKK